MCFIRLLFTRQFILSVKLGILFLTFAIAAHASGQSPILTLSLDNVPIEKLFSEIRKQTGHTFIYSSQEISLAKPVSIVVKEQPLAEVLSLCFRDQPLSYLLEDRYIIIRRKEENRTDRKVLDIRGRVLSEAGDPLAGVTVTARTSGRAIATNHNGEFIFANLPPTETLLFTSVGYRSVEIKLDGKTNVEVILPQQVGTLDETIVIAYGNTTRRLNTGGVSHVSGEELERHPVNDPLAALQGRVAGLNISLSSGIPGAKLNVQLRGRTSLDLSLLRNDPLIVIDGVPFEAGLNAINQLGTAANRPNQGSEGGLSALNSINPSDIQSIEVLKDADATAIYGSRGANGVILITTKKARPGKLTTTVNFQAGWSRTTRTMDLLTTKQYVQVRREAFANDGITPTTANAYDILLWDTTRQHDLKKLYADGVARNTRTQFSLSGGSQQTSFYFSTGYSSQSNVFSRDLKNQVLTTMLNLAHTSKDNRFRMQFNTYYSYDKNNMIQNDPTQYLGLPPNTLLYDSLGEFSWKDKGVEYSNPLAALLKKYNGVREQLSANSQLSYNFSGISLKLNMGYTRSMSDELTINPKKSIQPSSSNLASASFAGSDAYNWIIEPQMHYSKVIGKSRIGLLTGMTIQSAENSSYLVLASNYTNDLLLGSLAAAGSALLQNNEQLYRYTALFGRVNYSYNNTYLLNATFRRDGSSRFGPGRRFTNFGSIGMGWIFTNEKFMKSTAGWLSFGKLRASYGRTGNDQLGNYKFYDLWTNSSSTYGGVPGVTPSSLFNPIFSWEMNNKLELAVELGMIRDRVHVATVWYRNRSSNQLVSYRLPIQSGFGSVTRNFPALVQNSGWEWELRSKNIDNKLFTWSSMATLTIPRNKLISFPGLKSSSYASLYVEGRSLNISRKYRYLGVDTATGLYKYEDVNKDGLINSQDLQARTDLGPVCYGGLSNEFRYKNWEATFFLEFKKQTASNYRSRLSSTTAPGRIMNHPNWVLDRWQNPGDHASVQRYSTLSNGPTGQANASFSSSDAIYSDASYIRLKNVSLTYHLPEKIVSRIKFTGCRVYLQAQNLAVLTSYRGADPEVNDPFVMPPMRTVVAGLACSF